jgi:hypothetical protein
LTRRTDDLLSFLDRLIAAERNGYHCQREMGEVISELKGELVIGEYFSKFNRSKIEELRRMTK